MILQDRLDKLSAARSNAKEETSQILNKFKLEKQEIEKDFREKINSETKENINALGDEEKKASDTLAKDIINLAQIISDKFTETPIRIENVDSQIIEKIMRE